MECNTRREEILKILASAGDDPVNATALANRFGITRQIIVSDVALLRANGNKIISSKRGYFLERDGVGFVKEVVVCRHDSDNVRDELYAVVDNGGKLLNVIVEHPIYGQITGELNIASRYDANEFLKSVSKTNASQLCDLTGGVHYHTIQCPDTDTIERIRQELDALGILLH